MVKDRYPASVVNREHKAAHCHQRHKTDGLYRNGFAARIRARDNYCIKIRAETDIDRHNLVLVNKRMSCTSQLYYALVIKLRDARPHCIGKLSLCENKIQLNRTFVAILD